MFTKIFDDGWYVEIEGSGVALYSPDGEQATNSNVDYYFDEDGGYGCTSYDEVADLYYKNFRR
jgi:hypothetical protein